MGAAIQELWQAEWSITADKIRQAVERIIAAGNPTKVIAYGSRVRKDFRSDSDFDLAVILDHIDPNEPVPVRSSLFRGIPLDIDLLVTDMVQHERSKPWPGSVHYDIAKEGIVLYERGRDAGANADALEKIGF